MSSELIAYLTRKGFQRVNGAMQWGSSTRTHIIVDTYNWCTEVEIRIVTALGIPVDMHYYGIDDIDDITDYINALIPTT